MNISTFLHGLLYTLIVLAGITIVGQIIMFINAKIDALQTSDKLTYYTQLNRYIDTAQNIISNTVTVVTQTYVDTLKTNGSWNDKTAKTAKEKAIELAKSMMTIEVVDAIKEVYGDFGTYLDTMIESVVKENK